MSAVAAHPAVRAVEASGALLPLGVARGAAYAALALFGGLHWMQLVEPGQQSRALVAVVVGIGVCLLLVGARRLEGPARAVVAALTAVVGIALAVLAAGVGDELLAPARLGELLGGLTRGVDAIPGARVPYRGLDEWTHTTLVAGGTLLVVVAALFAFWPRRTQTGFRMPALIALVALYATPAVALVFEGEFARGALLTILVLAFLRLERMGSRDAPGAVAAGALTAVLALMIAPMLDRENPWWDYETWALSAASSRSTTFNWDHEYGPLDWPRDGRELLRVKAKFSTYWKADALDMFDGRRWRHEPLRTPQLQPHLPEDPLNLSRYRQTITVTIRNLRSRNFITAGVTEDVDFPRREALPTGVAGIWRAPRTLRRGDAYSAEVYTPRGRPRELRRAGSEYEDWLDVYRSMRVAGPGAGQVHDPQTGGFEDAARYEVTFPEFDDVGPPLQRVVRYVNDDGEDARPLLEKSAHARTWALAQELKADAETPYDYVRAVEEFLRERYDYTETPPRESRTLEGFLFRSRSGYCQQFSGAMALLLRMGGVPARVATGFTSGSQDRDTKEYVVRDFDAHSWVEAWFPGWGWIPFDPTPAAAPPRAQAPAGGLNTAGFGDVRDLGTGQAASDPRLAGADGDGGVRWSQVIGIGLIALVLLALTWRLGLPLLRRPLHQRRLSPLAELERALQRARLAGPANQTLRGIETRFPPPAAAYVRAVREARFAGRPTRPTAAQRRALRAALGRGSVTARLRSYWALPPRPRV